MRRHQQLHKLFSFLFLAVISSNAFAQTPAAAPADSTFKEGNLAGSQVAQPQEAAPATAPKDTLPAEGEIKNSALINKVGGGLANILLGNKVGSLMYDDEESGNIERAVESLKNNQLFVPEGQEAEQKPEEAVAQEEKKSEENEKSYIYLASIIYFSQKDWAVWINEQKITPESNKKGKELYIKTVERDHVRLLWTLSISKWKILSGRKSEEFAPKVNAENQVEVEFILKPNQTFILSTTTVVEGRAVIALLKKKEEEKKAREAERGATKTTTPTTETSTTPAER